MNDSLGVTETKDFINDEESLNRILNLFNREPILKTESYINLPYWDGNIRNLKVKVFEQQIKIDGSLSCFYLGDNQKTLDLYGLKAAIAELEDLLGMKLGEASVRRFDLAQNLIMDYDPDVYYSLFLKGGYFNRLQQDNGIYIMNKSRKISMYNKNIERKAKKKKVHEILREQYPLRYELSFSKQALNYYFQTKNVTLSYLIENYRTLINMWHDSYKLIPKDIRFIVPSEEVFTTPRSFVNYCAIVGIKSMGGYSAIVDSIDQAKKRGLFKKSWQPSMIKSKIQELLGGLEVENLASKLFEELEQKLSEARDFALFNSN